MIAMNLRISGIQRFHAVNSLPGDLPHPRDVLARKQQTLRIDVTCMDECLRFLGAAARIVLVDEPALILHEVMKIAAGARLFLPEIVSADVQKPGADSVADSEDLAEHVNQPLLAVETDRKSTRLNSSHIP